MRSKKNIEDVRTCFVIMPFGLKKDLARGDKIQFDRVYSRIIEPAVKSLAARKIRIQCIRSDKIQLAGSIHERMITRIADADVAVVDLTSANPNVYYELGVRHALRDRVTVLLRRKGTSNPFNIGGMTTIEYDLDSQSAARAREAIANFIANGLLSGGTDSLVYTVLPGLKDGRAPKRIDEIGVEEFAVPGAPGKLLGIVKGNLRHVNLGAALRQHPIDVWVNSENVNMEMARVYDRSISGLIRYLGAKKDITSTIVKDSVADDLRARMAGRQLVNPGEVVSTGAGTLARSHHVKRIYHAAAVYGVVGEGYHSIANVEQCITNALARLDWEARGYVVSQEKREAQPARQAVRSILFPLLATGTARADVIQSARAQLGTVLNYLRSRAEFTRVERVYFLAPNETVLAGMRVALAELGVQRRAAVRKAPGRTAHAGPVRRKRRRTAR